MCSDYCYILPLFLGCWFWNMWTKGKTCKTLWEENTFCSPYCALLWCTFWRQTNSKKGALRIPAELPLEEGNFGTHWIRVWMSRTGCFGKNKKFLILLEIEPRNVQLRVSLYTNYNIPAPSAKTVWSLVLLLILAKLDKSTLRSKIILRSSGLLPGHPIKVPGHLGEAQKNPYSETRDVLLYYYYYYYYYYIF
jgi:hypothetical protein